MTDPLIPEHPGLIPSFLDFVDRLGQPGLNLIHGNLGGAGRQLVDLLGDIPDAILPGDLIPHISRPEDFVSGHQLTGIDQQAHPALAKGADVLIDTLANPASFFGGSMFKGAGKAIGAGLAALPQGAQEGVAAAGAKLRSIAGAENLSPEVEAIRNRALAAESAVKKAQYGFGADLFKGTSKEDQEALGQVMHGVETDQAGNPVQRLPGATAQDRLASYLATPRPGVNAAWLKDAVGKVQGFNQIQWKEGLQRGTLGGNQFYDKGMPPTPDYFPRQFSGFENGAGEDATSRAKFMQNRAEELDNPDKLFAYLQAHPEIKLQMNAKEALAQRASGAGEQARRASIGRDVTQDPDYAQADPVHAANAQSALADLSSLTPEESKVLTDLYQGLPAREGIPALLAGANRGFKKFAVYGAVIPKLGTMVSNLISGAWQIAANPETRYRTLASIKDIIPNAIGSVAEGGQYAAGPGGVSDFLAALDQGIAKVFGTNVSGADLAEYENAFRQSGGSVQRAMQMVQNPTMKAAIENGVIGSGFVDSEQMLNEANRTGWKGFAGRLWDMPGKMFQGTEDRMRYSIFKSLTEDKGMAPADAAREANESLYNYHVSSADNRLARDIVPFFQFQAKAIPQAAAFLKEKPWLMPILSQLNNQSQGQPIEPYMQGKTNIPIGKDEQGKDQYITGLRLPYESLSAIPNPSSDPLEFGREIEQNIIGSTQPLLKTAYSYISGRDPYYESTPGSYTKIPALDDTLGTEAGRIYGTLASTGAIQPLDSALRQIKSWTDPSHSVPVRLLDSLTGANIADVDPNKAIQDQLQETLSRDPDVQQYRTFYQRSKDPATQALLQDYQSAKKAVKEGRNSTELDPKDMDQAKKQIEAMPSVPGPLPPDTPLDRSHSVPLGGGVSSDGSVIHIDPLIPDHITVPLIGGGETDINPIPLIKQHESDEFPLLQAGMKYQPAHALATAKEEARVKSMGIDPQGYQDAVMEHVKKAKKKSGNVPADLDPRPYLDSGLGNLLSP